MEIYDVKSKSIALEGFHKMFNPSTPPTIID